jgi:hypothetical protein
MWQYFFQLHCSVAQNPYCVFCIVYILYEQFLRPATDRCKILKAIWLKIEWILLKCYFFNGDGIPVGYKTRPASKTELQQQFIQLHATFQAVHNSIISLAK